MIKFNWNFLEKRNEMTEIKEKMKKNQFEIIVFLVYIVFTFLFILFHETWRDEAQQWLIVKELSIPKMIKQMQYEGHFVLWYLILMPFAKLGFPYITENVISWLICIVSVILILKYAPFSKWKKLLLVFSYPLFYLYPVVSRCYCLIPLAIALLAIFYQARYEKQGRYLLALILLINTHIIMLGMVVYLFLEFCYGGIKEKKSIGKSVLVFVVLAILSGLPLLGSIATNQDVSPSISLERVANIVFIQPLIILQENFNMFLDNTSVIAIAILCAVIVLFYFWKENRKLLGKIFLITLWQCAIYELLFNTSDQKATSTILIIIFFLWIQKGEAKKPILYTICTSLLMILSIASGLIFAVSDLKYNYSSAKETAEFINQNLNGEIFLTGNQPEFCTSMMPYIKDSKFYFIQKGIYFTYATWDKYSRMDLTEEAFDDAVQKLAGKELYYVYEPAKQRNATDEEMVEKLSETKRLEKVFESQKSLTGEEYIIYKIK